MLLNLPNTHLCHVYTLQRKLWYNVINIELLLDITNMYIVYSEQKYKMIWIIIHVQYRVRQILHQYTPQTHYNYWEHWVEWREGVKLGIVPEHPCVLTTDGMECFFSVIRDLVSFKEFQDEWKNCSTWNKKVKKHHIGRDNSPTHLQLIVCWCVHSCSRWTIKEAAISQWSNWIAISCSSLPFIQQEFMTPYQCK